MSRTLQRNRIARDEFGLVTSRSWADGAVFVDRGRHLPGREVRRFKQFPRKTEAVAASWLLL